MGRTETGTPARLPDAQGDVERDGVRTHWEAYGDPGRPAVLLLPTWAIHHSRVWKAQIGYLGRHFHVVIFDGGNGLSDRPAHPAAYREREYTADAVAVLDAVGLRSACVVGVSRGGLRALLLAAGHPDRVDGACVIDATVPHLDPAPRDLAARSFDEVRDDDGGWARYIDQAARGRRRLGPGHDPGDADRDRRGDRHGPPDAASVQTLCRGIRCPVLVLHGSWDHINPPDRGERIAEFTGGELVRLEGSGHSPTARDPVRVNLLLRDFAQRCAATPARLRTWTRAPVRERRALFVSSPIGLGHAWRDVAIADALRRRLPGLRVEWLAQAPVTTVLRERGEAIHPASAELSSEARHIDHEAGEHDLHAFQALRRMDDILAANYMVFDDLVSDEAFDVWVGDEAWDLDHFLHENPERKRAPYVWLTDFVGYLPMEAGGGHEAFLTADYNAEMIEHVERCPRVRDRAIFVGDPDDVVPLAFGPGLPAIREWTECHYRFAGYIPGFDPATLADRATLRAQLGYGPEPLCLVSVGGSGVGTPLMHRVVAALPRARELVPGLRMVAVTGPRIDAASLPPADGLEVRGYVHELYRHLAACDVGVVQGGLTTTMELVAAGRPFVALPLASHFEQRFHVRHRLDRYGARAWLDYDDADPESVARAIADGIAESPVYRPVDGPVPAAPRP